MQGNRTFRGITSLRFYHFCLLIYYYIIDNILFYQQAIQNIILLYKNSKSNFIKLLYYFY